MSDSLTEKAIIEDTEFSYLGNLEYYDAFVQMCKDAKIGSGRIPTYAEWLDLVGADDESLKKLGFNVDPRRVAATVGAFRGVLGTIGIDADTQDSFINAAGNTLKEQVLNNVRQTGSRMFQRFASDNDEGGGDGGTSQANYMGGSNWNPTGLSLKNKPINVSFDADIRFIGADKYYLDGADKNTPLLLKCGVPGLILHNDADHSDIALENYFVGPIVQEFQRAIAARVTYSNTVTGQFSSTRIREYINNILQAVCTYYFWTSILAYTADTRNKNGAMEVLSNSLSPTEKDNLVILKKAIEQAVIPPFIHKWAFYIMGNFKQSHVPGSPMMKFMPWTFKDATGHVFTQMKTITVEGQEYGSITSATQNLNEIRDLMDVLGAAFPDWTNMELFEYTSTPEIDMDYSNVWCNGYYDTTSKHSTSGYQWVKLPNLETNPENAITWNSQTDAPKGWSQAMQAICFTENSALKFGPGFFSAKFITPNSQHTSAVNKFYLNHSGQSVPCFTSCLIYDGGSAGAEGFVDVSTLARYQALAKNTYSTTHSSTTYHSHQKNGCALIKLQSMDVIRQACFKWLDLYTQDLKDAPASSNWSKNSAKKNSKSKYSKSKSKAKSKIKEVEEEE